MNMEESMFLIRWPRDEMVKREGEREEYRESRYKIRKEEKEKLLRNFFTEKEIQDFRDMVESDRKRRIYKNYSYHPIAKKEEEIYQELRKKYPDLVGEKFPQILPNGNKYYIKGLSKQELEETDLNPYYQKIKEYMGEKVFKKLGDGFSVTSYYINDENEVIPVTVATFIYDAITIYGFYGDEAAGFKLTTNDIRALSGDEIFYLIDDKFVKTNERGENWLW